MTKKDVKILKDWGYTEQEISQIERAEETTVYTLKKNGNRKGSIISSAEAKKILGRERYLGGLSRSAFHWSSSQNSGNVLISFDSSKMFKGVRYDKN